MRGARRSSGASSPIPSSAPARLGSAYLTGPAPVTMHIDEVERVWSAIAERDDWAPLAHKLEEVRRLGTHLSAPPVIDPDEDP